ncbi:MAG: DNA repair protein [Faecousia sp.]
MTDKELRRLSRSELLGMLIAQMEENERLRDELDQARAELKSRRIVLSRAGSIAEAALRLNEVFEAADNAANQYLENVRWLAEEVSNDYEDKTMFTP